MIGDGRMRAEWNRALLQDLIAPTYVRMLMFVSPKTGPGSAYDSLWPLRAAGPAWQELLDAFYQVMEEHGSKAWLAPDAGAHGDGMLLLLVVVWRAASQDDGGGLHAARRWQVDQPGGRRADPGRGQDHERARGRGAHRRRAR